MTGQTTVHDAVRAAFEQEKLDGLIGVAVSGGSDSLALLHIVSDLCPGRVRAATVDHGLRAESSDEARQVAQMSVALGIPHDTLTWTDHPNGGNLQDAARRARYDLLGDWGARNAIPTIVTGHTADDNAESFLMGLSRAAGLDGLSGMRPSFQQGQVTFLRPLLSQSRSDLRDFLRDRHVAWIEDPSNNNRGFDRIKARDAMAALEPLGITAAGLGGVMHNLRSTRAGISQALGAWASMFAKVDHGDLILTPEAFVDLPDEFARRILNAAFRWVASADYPPRSESVMRIVSSEVERGGQTLHGCLIRIDERGLVLGREPEAAKRAKDTKSDQIWDGRWEFSGPHQENLRIRALGEALNDCPDWRDSGLPRATLLSSPALFDGKFLVSAPIPRPDGTWSARLTADKSDFGAFLMTH